MKAAQLLFLVALLPALAHSQSVYKYVDQDRRVHYTDRPPDTVQKTEIRIERPDAPVQKADNWRDREREMNQRRIASASQQEECDARRDHLRALRTALSRNPRAIIYEDGLRITPSLLDYYDETYWARCP